MWKVTSLAVVACLAASPLSAADMSKTVQDMLKVKHLSPDILNGLDAELNLPKAWIDGARKEGTVTMRASEDKRNMDKVLEVFHARYPFIDAQYTTVRGRDLLISPMIAFKQGTILSDIVGNFNGTQNEFGKLGMLIPVTDLPAWKGIPDRNKRDDVHTIGWKTAYWCTSYNSDKVKPAELPKTWDELSTNPRWRNQSVGMSSRPHLWLANLWGVYGDKWLKNYEDRIFDEWKPQFRKESTNAMTKLLVVGEFDLAVPASEYSVLLDRKKGAPVAFHCPEPVPTQAAPLGIMKGAPHVNAARVLMNWLLSKEGQVAINTYIGIVPTHKDLQSDRFVPFPETILGKKEAPQTAKVGAALGKIRADWNKRWLAVAGK